MTGISFRKISFIIDYVRSNQASDNLIYTAELQLYSSLIQKICII